jgi:hypothetical protein
MNLIEILPDNIQTLINILQKFKNEINKKYDFICLQSMYYNYPNLVLYDIEKNIKEIWENNEKIDIISFIECVTIQLRIMEMMNVTFFAISLEDIYLLHYKKPIYVILSNDIIKINKNHYSFLTPPTLFRDKDEYLLPPELLRLKKIPATLHKSAIYYSIGLIVFLFLFGCPIWTDNYYMDHIPVIKYIEKIKGTKLYFFLKRSFESELLYV